MSGVVRQPARKISNLPPSNRTSSSSNNSNQRRSGRATPSSESKLQPRSKSVVDLLPPPPVPLPAPKKKGFSLFSIFKRNKKKGEICDHDAAAAAVALADIKAEEMRLLHEEEFTKLRRQREKDRSRSLYDMLPSQTRLTASEPASRNLSSPSTHSNSPNQRLSYQSPPRMLDHSPVPRMHDQSPVPRMRSASSSNVQTPRPATYYPNQLNAASRSSTHFYSPDAQRSTDSVASPNHRTMAKSPLIPTYYDSRQSFYALSSQSQSHFMHCPPMNHRSSRAYN